MHNLSIKLCWLFVVVALSGCSMSSDNSVPAEGEIQRYIQDHPDMIDKGGEE
jgi:hypothetical protein